MTRGTRGSAPTARSCGVSQVLSANVSILKTCLAYLGGLHVIWLCYGRSMVVSGEDWSAVGDASHDVPPIGPRDCRLLS